MYDSLTPQQQKWIVEAIKVGKETSDALTIKSEDDAISFLKSKGLKIVTVDLNAWKAYAYDYYKTDPIIKDWDMDLYEKTKKLAK